MKINEVKIAVIGLGYVGLPLARLFSTKFKTIGFDMNQGRVDALMAGYDATLEVSDELLQSALRNGFVCTTNLEDIKDCNFLCCCRANTCRRKQSSRLEATLGSK